GRRGASYELAVELEMSRRGAVPGQLGACPPRAFACSFQRRRISKELSDRLRESLDVTCGDDAACLVRQDRLRQAADVVDHRGHAGPERAEERAGLVQLRAVGEDGDGRLAESPVELRVGEIA